MIRKNEDGTVDVVSEYISSNNIYIHGKVGYMNYVGVLNLIAAQYTKERYVQSTRHMGYDNQLDYCLGNLSYGDIETCPTDTKYLKDVDFVNKAIGGLKGTTTAGIADSYYISSRRISIDEDNGRYSFVTMVIYINGNLGNNSIAHIDNSNGTWVQGSKGFCIRPILTFKATNVIKSGDGKSAETAYMFE